MLQYTAPDITKNFWFWGVAMAMRKREAANSATAAAALIIPTALWLIFLVDASVGNIGPVMLKVTPPIKNNSNATKTENVSKQLRVKHGISMPNIRSN